MLHSPVEHEATPHDCLVLAGEESHGDHFQQSWADGVLEGEHLAALGSDRPVQAEQPRDRMTPYVGVEQPHDQPAAGEGYSQVHADRRLADTTFARGDSEHFRLWWDVGRQMPLLGLEARPAHQRRPLGGVHHPGADLHPGDAGQRVDVALDIGAELVAKRAGGDGEGHLYTDRAPLDAYVAHHPELDDVGAELGVDHPLESGADLRLGRSRRPTWLGWLSRGRRLTRTVHCIIETNGAVGGVFSRPALDQKEISVSLSTSTVKLGQRPSPVTLTDAAAAKVSALLEQEGEEGLALRVAVRPGGCSGYSYEIFFDSEVADDDIVRTFGTVRVVVDPESADLIKGATLEYRDGLQEAGFHIVNPNATRTCGCGSSFS